VSPPADRSARHLLVTNDFPPKVGGIQSYLWELWQRLDPKSYVVLTASSHPAAKVFDADQSRFGIRIERLPGKLLYFPTPRVRAAVGALLEESGASFVVFDPVLPLGLLGREVGVPYGVVLHGAETVVPARTPGGRALLSRVLEGASLVISAGHYPRAVAASLFDTHGAGRGHPGVLVEIPPGVDCDRIVPLDEVSRREVRRRFGLSEDAMLVASVSRLVPRKGMDVLVEAARRLAPSLPRFVVAIAGSGRDAGRLDAQIRRTGAPVRLLGSVSEDDKAALLGAADVFAMVCRNRWGGLEQEGFGIVFLEAAAAGVPQVAGRSGGAGEAVEDGVTGLVVARPKEPGHVAEALRRLLVDDDGRRAMGVAARERACTQFDRGALAAKLAASLAEVQG
jgi:phosphatidyl-myo-inositol dimannoside synthase